MNNSAIVFTGTNVNCWVIDRFISDDNLLKTDELETGFDWIESYGFYQDFAAANLTIPGWQNLPYRFVMNQRSIIC